MQYQFCFRLLSLIVLVLGSSGSLWRASPPARADSGVQAVEAIRTVNSTADPGSGGCNSNECTLREAIAASVAGDTIRFSLPANATIILNAGQLTINKNLNLDGSSVANLTISGGGRSRVFETSAAVRMVGLTIINGRVSTAEGSGILNHGNLTIEQSTIRGNNPVGIQNNGTLTLRKSTVSHQSSDGILNRGTSTINDSTISENNGNGIWNEAILNMTNSTVSTNLQDGISNRSWVSINHVTIADNGGNGIHNEASGSNSFSLRNTIVGDNVSTDCSGVAVVSQGYNLARDASCNLTASSDIPDAAPRILPLADNGGSTQTHALVSTSPGINRADPACPPPNTDQRGVARPQGAGCDIGAYEWETPNRTIFLGSSTNGTAGTINFADDDLLAYNMLTTQWTKYFDGSDVGLANNDVKAFAFDDANNLLLSFRDPITLPVVGFVTPNDVVRFIPTSLGETTRGSYEWVLDGSDVGLNTVSEYIDDIEWNPNNVLVLSTEANYSVAGLTGQDEDLIALTNAQYGSQTGGDWVLYFDGTTADLTSSTEDLQGIATWDGQLFMTTLGNFTVSGVSGDADDILSCVPISLGIGARCHYRPFFDGDKQGLGNEEIDGIEIVDDITINVTSSDSNDSIDAPDSGRDQQLGDDEVLPSVYLPVASR